MSYYYLNSSGAPTGPVSLEQIECLVEGGLIAADPLVCEQGTEDWVPLSSLPQRQPTPDIAGHRQESEPPAGPRHQSGRLTVTEGTPGWLVWVCNHLWPSLLTVLVVVYAASQLFKMLFR